MPSRASLELRAAAVNLTPSSYPNDSVFEKAVLAAEKALTASSAATTQAPSAKAVAGES
jgi:hypothetical protein